MSAETPTKTFTLKKSDIRKSNILVPLWVYTCPLCYRQIISHTPEKVLMYAKLHIERSHKLPVVIEE
jgi:hypothetical protein